MKISIKIDHEDGSPVMALGWDLPAVLPSEVTGTLAAIAGAVEHEIRSHKAPKKVAA